MLYRKVAASRPAHATSGPRSRQRADAARDAAGCSDPTWEVSFPSTILTAGGTAHLDANAFAVICEHVGMPLLKRLGITTNEGYVCSRIRRSNFGVAGRRMDGGPKYCYGTREGTVVVVHGDNGQVLHNLRGHQASSVT